MSLLVFAQISVAEESVVLASPMLDLIDGKSFAINGEVYGLILQVRREVRKRLFGNRTQDGQFVGIYEFDGQLYSVTELTILESQYEEEFNSRLDELEKTKNSYQDNEWQEAVQETEHAFEEIKKEMREVLEFAKEDFLEITSSYIGSCRGFKDQVMALIQESCDRRNNKNCFLLKWGEEKEGKEGELMREEMVTFKGFETFCIDLTHYLEDMARSCPKGKKLFIELLKELRAQK